jgi:hypothetical protein
MVFGISTEAAVLWLVSLAMDGIVTIEGASGESVLVGVCNPLLAEET